MKRAIGAAFALIASLAAPTAAQAQAALTWSGHTWRVYDGAGMLGQQWRASHVTVGAKRGYLHLRVAGGVTGGVAMTTGAVTGRWSVTFRMTRGPGKYAILLWPVSGPRPELDFAEDKPVDRDRTWCTATWHPAAPAKSLRAYSRGDYTQWHRATVVVHATVARLFLDGHLRAEFPAPGVAMRLAIQTSEMPSERGSSTLVVARASAPA